MQKKKKREKAPRESTSWHGGGENKNLVKQGGGGAENGQVTAEKCTFLIWQGQEKCDQMVMGYEACFFALGKIKKV